MIKKKNILNYFILYLFVITFAFLCYYFLWSFLSKGATDLNCFALSIEKNEGSLLNEQERTTLYITNIEVSNKEYDGLTKIEITNIVFSGLENGDDVQVSAFANTYDAEVGNYKCVIFSQFTLTGEDCDKYEINISNLPNVFVDITPKQVLLNWKKSSQYSYTGEEQKNTISVYYKNVLDERVYLDFSIIGKSFWEINNTKTTFVNQFIYAGTYTFTANTTKNEKNYNFSNSEIEITMNKAIPIITISPDRTFVYNGLVQYVDNCVSLNNTEQELKFTNNSFTSVAEGNSLIAEVWVDSSANYYALAEKQSFGIQVLKAPSIIDVSEIKKDYIYNKTEQVINSGAKVNNSEQTVFNYYNNKFTTVEQGNNKCVTVEVCESDNYLSSTTSFYINVKKYRIDTSTWVWSQSNWVYNGSKRTIYVNNYNQDLVEARYTDNQAIDAGVYVAKVNFALVDTENYENISFPDKIWSITRATVKKPILEKKYSSYNGVEQILEEPKNVEYEYLGNSQTNAGEYEVFVKLKNIKNYIWSDNSDETLSFKWIINKAKLSVPNYISSLTYNGEKQDVYILPSDLYSIITEGQVNIGEYRSYLVLNDDNNYEWEGSNNNYIVLNWKIVSSDYNMSKPILSITIAVIIVSLIALYATFHFTIKVKRKKQKMNLVSQNQDLNFSNNIKNSIEEDKTKNKIKEENQLNNQDNINSDFYYIKEKEEEAKEEEHTQIQMEDDFRNQKQLENKYKNDIIEVNPEEIKVKTIETKQRKKRMVSMKKNDKKVRRQKENEKIKSKSKKTGNIRK